MDFPVFEIGFLSKWIFLSNEICQNVEEIQYPEFENNNYVLMGESNLEMSDIKLEEIQNENQNSDFKSKMFLAWRVSLLSASSYAAGIGSGDRLSSSDIVTG